MQRNVVMWVQVVVMVIEFHLVIRDPMNILYSVMNKIMAILLWKDRVMLLFNQAVQKQCFLLQCVFVNLN